MNCVILQPSYIPWRGYFHQIEKADVFVFYDDVQYDTRGWRNRNRICGPRGSFWLTVPIQSKNIRSLGLKINEVQIDWSQPWNKKHLKSLAASYRKAPHFGNYEELLLRFYSRRDCLLVDFVIELTIALSQELGIYDTRFLTSSSLQIAGGRSERLLRIVKEVGADHYITGPAARSYLDVELFLSHDVTVEFLEYDYPPYEQLSPKFDPQVSILDLLFMKGREAPHLIW